MKKYKNYGSCDSNHPYYANGELDHVKRYILEKGCSEGKAIINDNPYKWYNYSLFKNNIISWKISLLLVELESKLYYFFSWLFHERSEVVCYKYQ